MTIPFGRRLAALFTVAGILVVVLLISTLASAAPAVTTDKAEYHPDETAIISGTGYTSSGPLLDVVVIRPDLSIVTGDGTNTSGFDTVTKGPFDAFTFPNILNGIFGLYTVNVYDHADTLHTVVLAHYLPGRRWSSGM